MSDAEERNEWRSTNHLPRHGARDFDAAVKQILWDWGTLPSALADVPRGRIMAIGKGIKQDGIGKGEKRQEELTRSRGRSEGRRRGQSASDEADASRGGEVAHCQTKGKIIWREKQGGGRSDEDDRRVDNVERRA